jgi:hypothetical protein
MTGLFTQFAAFRPLWSRSEPPGIGYRLWRNCGAPEEWSHTRLLPTGAPARSPTEVNVYGHVPPTDSSVG